MTSIATAGAAGYLSPRDRLQNELLSEVSSGSISSSDQSALSSALDDIDQSLKADRTSDSQASGPPSPDQMKSKIDDLINGEVQNGKLTSAQATELQNVFSNAFAKGGPGGAGGPGGPGGAGGHHGHHGGGAGEASSSDSSSSAADALVSAINSNSSDATSSTDGTDSLIQTFLQSLKDSQQQGAGYTANGDSGSAASSNALVVDFTS
jgi:hypothetical protein